MKRRARWFLINLKIVILLNFRSIWYPFWGVGGRDANSIFKVDLKINF